MLPVPDLMVLQGKHYSRLCKLPFIGYFLMLTAVKIRVSKEKLENPRKLGKQQVSPREVSSFEGVAGDLELCQMLPRFGVLTGSWPTRE